MGGQLKFGSGDLHLINADDQEDAIPIAIQAPGGTNYVDLASIHPDAAQRLDCDPDPEVGDQIQWGNVVGGVIGDVTVYDDDTHDANENVISFEFRVWDATDGRWGPWATQYPGAAPGSGGGKGWLRLRLSLSL